MGTGNPPIGGCVVDFTGPGGCVVEFPPRYGFNAPWPSAPVHVIDYGQYQPSTYRFTPFHAHLSDEDVDRIAQRVAKILRDQKDTP